VDKVNEVNKMELAKSLREIQSNLIGIGIEITKLAVPGNKDVHELMAIGGRLDEADASIGRLNGDIMREYLTSLVKTT